MYENITKNQITVSAYLHYKRFVAENLLLNFLEERKMTKTKLKPRSWNEGTKECYRRGCRCGSDCDNYRFCKDCIDKGVMPPMKVYTIASVREFGRPVGVKQELRGY